MRSWMDFACSHINILHPLTGLQQPDPEALAQGKADSRV